MIPLPRRAAVTIFLRIIIAYSWTSCVVAGFLPPPNLSYSKVSSTIVGYSKRLTGRSIGYPTSNQFQRAECSTIGRRETSGDFRRSSVGARRAQSVLRMGPVHGSASFRGKINTIRHVLTKKGGRAAAAGLQVMMDFDLTMTAPGSEQCHHMFETSSSLPIEIRSNLTPYIYGQVQVSSPEEWWDSFHGVLVGAKLTREQVTAVVTGANVSLRHGTEELLSLLSELGVPLLIVSAGISNVIEETLRSRGLLFENITIYANTMLFDDSGRLQEFRESPPVHSRNKRETAERLRAYFAKHPHRSCAIIVGDKPGDADINYGIAPDERCLKIGFFDHSDEHPHSELPLHVVRPAAGELEKEPAQISLHSPADAETAREVKKGHSMDSEKHPRKISTPHQSHAGDERKIRPSDSRLDGFKPDEKLSLLHVVQLMRSQKRPRQQQPTGHKESTEAVESNPSQDVAGVDPSDALDLVVSTSMSTDSQLSSGKQQAAKKDNHLAPDGGTTALLSVDAEIEIMLKAYAEKFDVVAHGEHSMDLVSVAVMHLIDDLQ